MCISRGARPPKRSTEAFLKDEDAELTTFEPLKQVTLIKGSVSTTCDCESLKQTDTETTASSSSEEVSEANDEDVSLSDLLGDIDDLKKKSRSRRSDSVVSWADEPSEEEEEDPSNEPLSLDTMIGENSLLQEKRNRLTSLRKNIFQRLDSMSSILQEDCATASECAITDETSSSTSSHPLFVSDSCVDDVSFESMFEPHEMKCLALVAQGHMKPALLDYVKSNRELLKKFRLVGPKDTVNMLRSIYDNDDEPPTIVSCPATPGYSAEVHLAVQICMHDIGGVVLFLDPLATQQQRKFTAILTMANRHNVLVMTNPMTAMSMSHMLRLALTEGRRELAASFFESSASPAVEEYKRRQQTKNMTLKNNAVAESMLDATLLMNILSPIKM